MSSMYFELGCSTGEFKALQLIVFAVYGAVDYKFALRMLVHNLDT